MNIETTGSNERGKGKRGLENCPIEEETRQFEDANIFANFAILQKKELKLYDYVR